MNIDISTLSDNKKIIHNALYKNTQPANISKAKTGEFKDYQDNSIQLREIIWFIEKINEIDVYYKIEKNRDLELTKVKYNKIIFKDINDNNALFKIHIDMKKAFNQKEDMPYFNSSRDYYRGIKFVQEKIKAEEMNLYHQKIALDTIVFLKILAKTREVETKSSGPLSVDIEIPLTFGPDEYQDHYYSRAIGIENIQGINYIVIYMQNKYDDRWDIK